MAKDFSNGWEAVAEEFSKRHWRSTVGIARVQQWTRALPSGASILNIGCGPGSPRDQVLFDAGFAVHAIDASPTLARAYAERFPTAKVICESAEESDYFGQTFDAVFSWGLIFLLPPENQRVVLRRVPNALKNGGRFLFTAPSQVCTWADVTTGRTSFSLGEHEYTSLISDAGLTLVDQYKDDGDNHYYDTIKQ